MRVDSADSSHGVQTIFPHGSENHRLVRKISDSTWGEWEWENPPLYMGTEYRTTERWESKPVYIKYISLGQSPASANSTMTVNIGIDSQKIVRYQVLGSSGSATIGVPYVGTGPAAGMNANVTFTGTNVNICVSTGDFNGYHMRLILWYLGS